MMLGSLAELEMQAANPNLSLEDRGKILRKIEVLKYQIAELQKKLMNMMVEDDLKPVAPIPT